MNRLPLVIAIAFSSAAYGQVRVESLQEQDIDYGCGCSFHPPSEAPDLKNILLTWEVLEPAKMRINGRLERFTVSEPKSYIKPGASLKVGDRTVYKLESKDWSVTVDCRATRVCARGDESCESTSYAGNLLVASAKVSKVVKVQGTCGC